MTKTARELLVDILSDLESGRLVHVDGNETAIWEVKQALEVNDMKTVERLPKDILLEKMAFFLEDLVEQVEQFSTSKAINLNEAKNVLKQYEVSK